MLTLPGGVPRCLPRRLVLPSRPLLSQTPIAINAQDRELHLRKTATGSRSTQARGRRPAINPAPRLWRGHGVGEKPDYRAKRPQAFRLDSHPGQVKANARREWLANKRPAISSLEAEYKDNLDELTKYSNLARRQKEQDKERATAEVKPLASRESPEVQEERETPKVDEHSGNLIAVQAKVVELETKLTHLEALLKEKPESASGRRSKKRLLVERRDAAEGHDRLEPGAVQEPDPDQKAAKTDGHHSEPKQRTNSPFVKASRNDSNSEPSPSTDLRQQNLRERRRLLRLSKPEHGLPTHATTNGKPSSDSMSKLTANGKLENHVKKQEPIAQLTQEEIAMFQRAAEESSLSMPRSPVNALRTDAKNSDGAISILEELFPKELSRKSQASKPLRHVPKAPLDLPAEEAVELAKAEDTNSIPKEDALFPDEEVNQRTRASTRLNDQLTVLILRKASKHLTQDDFQRLMPGGRHIEGWSNRGRLISVIRARNTKSLEPTGDYFLVFSNTAVASAYLDHTNQQHRHSKAFSPRSLYGSIPPPPSLALSPGKKNKIDAPAYTYNLAPPSHDLTMRLVPQPFSPLMRQVIQGSGYPELTENKQSDHEVLLWFTSYRHSSFSVVRRAIDQDGKQRGSFWQTVGQNNGIRVLGAGVEEMASLTRAPRRRHGSTDYEDNISGHGTMEDGTPWKQDDKIRRFIVSFRDREEASRFVLAWHRRDVTKLIEAQMLAPWRKRPILGNAEWTW